MREKIIKNFTFESPLKMYDVESKSTRLINSTYRGAKEIWVYVDVETGLNPFFVSEGDLPDPTTTWKHRSILLNSENQNHIILMDMLKNSTGHESEEITEYFNKAGDVSLNPNFVFSYTMPKNPSSSETFDILKTKIDENNIVHYHWKSAIGLSKDELLEIVRVHKLKSEEILRDPIIYGNIHTKESYTKFIALLDYITTDLINRIEPWKISIPLIHEL